MIGTANAVVSGHPVGEDADHGGTGEQPEVAGAGDPGEVGARRGRIDVAGSAEELRHAAGEPDAEHRPGDDRRRGVGRQRGTEQSDGADEGSALDVRRGADATDDPIGEQPYGRHRHRERAERPRRDGLAGIERVVQVHGAPVVRDALRQQQHEREQRQQDDAAGPGCALHVGLGRCDGSRAQQSRSSHQSHGDAGDRGGAEGQPDVGVGRDQQPADE